MSIDRIVGEEGAVDHFVFTDFFSRHSMRRATALRADDRRICWKSFWTTDFL